jgi:hypothetical protein
MARAADVATSQRAIAAPLRATALAIDGHLWTQREAAAFLQVTTRYLRDSSCPKILLPGNGAKRQPLVRYDPDEVRSWARAWRAGGDSIRRAS